MKAGEILIIILLVLIITACEVDDIVSELGNSKITAKVKIGEVINKAKDDFADDAELASIYGREVSSEGETDLLDINNAFVYVVQSDSFQGNEFYVPVYQSAPVKSPVNFNTMISFIKDSTAKGIMETVFGTLATASIGASVSFIDSPEVLSRMFSRQDVSTFRTVNPASKIDMFLVPSKSVDTTSVTNSADWIVNFYSESSSLVLWMHPGTSGGTIEVISN